MEDDQKQTPQSPTQPPTSQESGQQSAQTIKPSSDLPSRQPEISFDSMPRRRPETVIKVVVPETRDKSQK